MWLYYKNTNMKLKYTKRHTNMKRKYTKRRLTVKRKYTNRKSKKYGGKCIHPTNQTEMNKLKDYLQRTVGLSFVEAKDIVDGMVNSEYVYDCGAVLKQLKTAVSRGRETGYYDVADIIFSTLNKINKQAEKSQPPIETQKEVSDNGCPSNGKEPVNCSEKKDYLKQTLIFHPDKNPMCREQSTLKFQALQNNPTCQFD